MLLLSNLKGDSSTEENIIAVHYNSNRFYNSE